MKKVEGVSFSEIDILPYQTTSLVGEKVIVFAPHPDDETVGCGDTIAFHCRHGDQVKVIVLTNGDKEDTRNRYGREEYVRIRKAEAKKNAIKTYKSQQAENDYYGKILGLNKYRTVTLSSQVDYAEGYYIVPSEKISKTPFDTLELSIFQPFPRVALNNNPLVSVIIGTNNRPQLLRNCLESLLVQTYKSFEVVLVNDGGGKS